MEESLLKTRTLGPAGPVPSASDGESFAGKTLSDVRIERLLGRGGMAVVFLGYHTRLNRQVAVKILYARMRKDPHLMDMLRKEADPLVAMKHPNIVNCIDCNVVEGRPWIVMDLLEGITLQDRLKHLRREGLVPPLHVVQRIICSTADALDHAHTQGILHRDLKPANMMLAAIDSPLDAALPLPHDVQVVLTDFGVARLMDTTERRDILVGTPAYMSPEQAIGDEVDGRSDVYSLGVVLYQMLAGQVPFEGSNGSVRSILEEHLRVPPPITPNVSPHIQEVVRRSLAKEPVSRFRRAGDLAKSLG
jgi:serine/threonine protein kinase